MMGYASLIRTVGSIFTTVWQSIWRAIPLHQLLRWIIDTVDSIYTTIGMAIWRTPSLYQPLSSKTSIRLLILHPDHWDSDIVCELRLADVSERMLVPYEALSYVWGDAKVTSTITLNGQPFEARVNLFSALRHLRFPPELGPRTLWIDALCINQSNLTECAQQVMIMRDIFAKAVHVVAWTGDAGNEGRLLIELCHRIGDQHKSMTLAKMYSHQRAHLTTTRIPRTLKNIRTLRKATAQGWEDEGCRIEDVVDVDEHNDLADYGNPDPATHASNAEFEAVMRFLRRPWFRRAWVVQEAVVPKQLFVQIGGYWISWEFLVSAFMSCSQHMGGAVSRSTWLPFYTLCQTRSAFQNQNGDFGLYDVLSQFRGLGATRALDKVYAFLGLTSDALDVTVDYTKSTQACYQEVIITLMDEYGNLDAFSISLRTRPSTHNLPSWVPDWSDIGPHPRCLVATAGLEELLPDMPKHSFCATQNSTMSATVVYESTLELQGHTVDSIAELGSVAVVNADEQIEANHLAALELLHNTDKRIEVAGRFFDMLRAVIGVYLSWYNLALPGNNRHEPYRPSPGHSMGQALMRTLVADHPLSGLDKATAAFEEWCEFLQSSELRAFLRTERQMDETAFQYFLRQSEAVVLFEPRWTPFFHEAEFSQHRRFAITRQGRFALVPKRSEVGDQLLLLQGGKVPYVMRRPGLSGTWEMIGDAYVHGIMNGEAYDSTRCEPVVVA